MSRNWGAITSSSTTIKHQMLGERTGQRFRLGDRVRVKLVRADPGVEPHRLRYGARQRRRPVVQEHKPERQRMARPCPGRGKPGGASQRAGQSQWSNQRSKPASKAAPTKASQQTGQHEPAKAKTASKAPRKPASETTLALSDGPGRAGLRLG